ncbi:hypothetical protein [Sphingorhabdus sp.]|uniref:hypothetical protein n=1 Tax=Sphingorhabdus sp. TaxID=1902408 RepID=UPI0033418A28
MPNTTTDLYTTVKNVSGAERVFGFLSKHGKRLANNATFTVPGDLVGALGAQRSQRQFQALERALVSGALEIVKSPSVYLRDESNTITRELGMASTKELGTTVPSYDGGGDFIEGDLNANDA